MCGIAGEICTRKQPLSHKEVYESMLKSLEKRGPDQSGIYLTDTVALVHSRLCVMDIENGKQPMSYKDDFCEYILVYNGELYNTGEIRSELINLGHSFRGHSDTEVVLHSYIQWGENCASKLNGIFAFSVWDSNRRTLFFARDRMGVKPFFFALRNGNFIFASEIKALLEHPLIEPEIDINSIAEIVLIGPGRTPGYGVFRGVEELEPACCGTFSEEHGLKIWKYWTLEAREHTDSFEETVQIVRELVIDSIERQLVSDVPIGTFLSGGLDSSLISSVAARYFTRRGQKLHTFSVDYIDNDKYFKPGKFQPNSDNKYIEIMNGYLNAENHKFVINTDELVDALYLAVEARDLPGMADIDSSLLLFCKEVKKYVTVALSGECADEVFGGYNWYRDKEIREKYGFPWAQSTEYRAGFLKPEFSGQIDPFAYVDERYKKTLSEVHKIPNDSATDSRAKEMMVLNLKWFMQTLLDRKDRMSMYNGLEVRVPFCDYRIVEYLYSVPWEYKDYKNYEKGLLREAMKGFLPDEILWRKKSPYPKTHHPAYLREVSNRLSEVISNPNSPVLQIADKKALEKLLVSDNPVPWYGQLMTTPQTIAYFLQINYWMEKYKVRIV